MGYIHDHLFCVRRGRTQHWQWTRPAWVWATHHQLENHCLLKMPRRRGDTRHRHGGVFRQPSWLPSARASATIAYTRLWNRNGYLGGQLDQDARTVPCKEQAVRMCCLDPGVGESAQTPCGRRNDGMRRSVCGFGTDGNRLGMYLSILFVTGRPGGSMEKVEWRSFHEAIRRYCMRSGRKGRRPREHPRSGLQGRHRAGPRRHQPEAKSNAGLSLWTQSYGAPRRTEPMGRFLGSIE